MITKVNMSPVIAKSAGSKIAVQWNGRSLLGRLQLIIENSELFHSLRLVTNGELYIAGAMSQSGLEYVLNREDCPIFTNINIKKDIEEQDFRERLETALNAVFL
ncbi:hypothetical protein JW758_00910 [Candidatus Peregrinibacteria bacterium]|nr:hypothetical protein [Candidatus Peregrinibacteria bacterium]